MHKIKILNTLEKWKMSNFNDSVYINRWHNKNFKLSKKDNVFNDLKISTILTDGMKRGRILFCRYGLISITVYLHAIEIAIEINVNIFTYKAY